ncbi:MAG: hypothetical protein V2I65_04785 [Paracoccaceae bacterium]|jgi:hypothetical protein|nr:hypothetical protein [Paracoccaceae bacterium]
MSRPKHAEAHQAAADLAALLGGLDAMMDRIELTDATVPGDRSAPAAIPVLVIEARRRAEELTDQLDQIDRPEK